ncbi:MAG: glycosyltransferase family 4 protein [Pseudomonadota bacterium]|nr:glycosyltransferase family 4 protein [Pseudomonadota bacterium]
MATHSWRSRESGVDSSASRKPIHLLLVTTSLECGGAERQMTDMANYWSARGLRVTLATWTGPTTTDFYDTDSRISRVYLNDESPGRIRVNLRRVFKLRRHLLESRPDAVLSFLTRSNVPTILAAFGLGLRVIVSERTQPAREIGLPYEWRILRRMVYRFSAGIVCQTRASAEWIRINWRTKPRVIPNALRSLPRAAADREKLVLGVGALKSEKGFDLLLEAYARISQDFPGWRVVILGEGPERAALLRLRDELGLRDHVEFHGRVRDVQNWMARAGLVVQPSRFEGFPNAVLESMGMGAVVVSADCPAGPAEMIDDGVNGRLVPVEDVRALSRAMAELMAQPELRLRLGREAMKVRERFGQELIMAQWEALLLPCAE